MGESEPRKRLFLFLGFRGLPLLALDTDIETTVPSSEIR